MSFNPNYRTGAIVASGLALGLGMSACGHAKVPEGYTPITLQQFMDISPADSQSKISIDANDREETITISSQHEKKVSVHFECIPGGNLTIETNNDKDTLKTIADFDECSFLNVWGRAIVGASIEPVIDSSAETIVVLTPSK